MVFNAIMVVKPGGKDEEHDGRMDGRRKERKKERLFAVVTRKVRPLRTSARLQSLPLSIKYLSQSCAYTCSLVGLLVLFTSTFITPADLQRAHH